MMLLAVAVGAAVGAPVRYLVDRAVQRGLQRAARAMRPPAFPWGILTVNLVGSLLLGILVRAAATGRVPAELVALLGTGFCGALTTFSTFAHQTLRLAQRRATVLAVANVLTNVVGCLLAAAAGAALAG